MAAHQSPRSLRWIVRIMRWMFYGVLLICLYAFVSAVVAYVRIKTGWGLSTDDGPYIVFIPTMAEALISSSLLVALASIVAILGSRRLEERMDEN